MGKNKAVKIVQYLILFLIINFTGLAIGGWLMNEGPTSDWYINLNQAPWTPDGLVFGVAWTLIMVLFSIYLAFLFKDRKSNSLWLLYGVQVFLNVIWNYIFFSQQLIGLGLLTIFLLLLVILYFFIKIKEGRISKIRFLLLPYLIWLCIATSLNAYIFIFN